MRRNIHVNNAAAYTPEIRRRCVAYHEAGHAAAIYLINRMRSIPPLLFNLRFSVAHSDTVTDFQTAYENYIACIEGGRLLHTLPDTLDDFRYISVENGQDWIRNPENLLNAFEADVINLLAGSLAEAKFVAEMDDEIFTYRLVDPPALENYGGSFDLALIEDYLQRYSPDQQTRDQKLNQLHQVAFNFINDYHNWRAISKLAEFILAADKDTICSEEVATILGE
ncbi:hypothetical protein [Candidatus Methylomicrobium oryzae]|jgi:hypothetical protein|uniref:hypothetical protein n=1 Tax=Candidatus Methylomicrobium oryzae TaxID=2802053 RepID=UPI0019250A99|nr:hypothetical protein [Methylomicrobium sp. RS1]MBL1263190.1 hypothetical protein [Methylomicrobium sp. RS1]